jgi:hypothetical protein
MVRISVKAMAEKFLETDLFSYLRGCQGLDVNGVIAKFKADSDGKVKYTDQNLYKDIYNGINAGLVKESDFFYKWGMRWIGIPKPEGERKGRGRPRKDGSAPVSKPLITDTPKQVSTKPASSKSASAMETAPSNSMSKVRFECECGHSYDSFSELSDGECLMALAAKRCPVCRDFGKLTGKAIFKGKVIIKKIVPNDNGVKIESFINEKGNIVQSPFLTAV